MLPGPAARAISSGAALRYQYVAAGSTWPKYVESRGISAGTSAPVRYQPSRVRTAKLWRKSWMRGQAEPAERPVVSRRWRKAPAKDA